MTATITITRRDERNEDVDFLVDITRDRDGDLWCVCAEDVEERRTTNRYGSIETHSTGRLLYRKGDPIELINDEPDEAEAALTQLEKLWNEECARLREIFRPSVPLDRMSEDISDPAAGEGTTAELNDPTPEVTTHGSR